MTTKVYALTQDELYRADLMSLRIMLALLFTRVLEASPNPDALSAELASAVAQLVEQIPAEMIEPDRRAAYREAVVERATVLLSQAKSIERGPPRRPN